jgi:hypothetical protein
MELAVFSALGFLILLLLLAWIATRIRYRITHSHLQVLLFGLPLRRIPLGQITGISKRRPNTWSWSERWYNTTKAAHRALVIRRSKGIFKNLVITPKNRYVFKTDLERAMQNLNSPPEAQIHRVSITFE